MATLPPPCHWPTTTTTTKLTTNNNHKKQPPRGKETQKIAKNHHQQPQSQDTATTAPIQTQNLAKPTNNPSTNLHPRPIAVRPINHCKRDPSTTHHPHWPPKSKPTHLYREFVTNLIEIQAVSPWPSSSWPSSPSTTSPRPTHLYANKPTTYTVTWPMPTIHTVTLNHPSPPPWKPSTTSNPWFKGK